MPDQPAINRKSSFLIGFTRESLDCLPWAIAKINKEGLITYGNRALCEIAGLASIEGRGLDELFDGADLAVVKEHLKSRFTSRLADDYRVNVTRRRDGARIPILCSAMPEIDEQGEVVGVIAFVRDLVSEDVSKGIHRAIEELRDGREILESVARECSRIAPFDMFGVTLYSADGDHYRSFYLYPEGFRPSVRWNEMTGYARKLVEARRIVNILDLQEWLELPEWRRYRDEQDVRQILALGLRSSVSYPVTAGNRVVASVGFGRKKDKGPFNEDEVQRLGRLPLEAAVNMALHHEAINEARFTLDLVREIASASRTTDAIADILTRRIAEHYGWESVSVFRPDRKEGQLWLVKQVSKDAFRLPPDWHRPIEEGMTGQVCRTGESVSVPDFDCPDFKGMDVRGCDGSRSGLCIPVKVSGRVYWLLNLEDSRRNAFAKEEQETLENIAREVARVLELTSQSAVFSELLKRSKDAVIQTDFRGVIEQTNPATSELLGYSEAEMKGQPLRRYFKDADLARRVEEAQYVPNDEITLLHKDGSEVSLLLSGTSLPKEIGLKVYVFNDLSTRKRMETLEVLRHMYNEIATEIKTPLSLAFTWLARLKEMETRPDAADILAKTIKQLGKVDLSYERLLFYERHGAIAPVEKTVFEIPYLVEKIKQDMPDLDADRIEITASSEVPLVRADLFQIWFCVQSMLAYLLRFALENGRISVNISTRDGRVEMTISGRAPSITGGEVTEYAETRWAIQAITEMALGKEMIRSFIEENHEDGTFSEKRREGDLVEYAMALPGI